MKRRTHDRSPLSQRDTCGVSAALRWPLVTNVDLVSSECGPPRAVGDPRTDKLFGTRRLLIGTTMGYIMAKTTTAITSLPILRAGQVFPS